MTFQPDFLQSLGFQLADGDAYYHPGTGVIVDARDGQRLDGSYSNFLSRAELVELVGRALEWELVVNNVRIALAPGESVAISLRPRS